KPHRLFHRPQLSAGLGRAHHEPPAGGPFRAGAGHDLPPDPGHLEGGLGHGDHRAVPRHGARCGDILQFPAPPVREAVMKPSPIPATVDYDKDGVQHGYLRLPYSRDDSAWGSIPIPIAVIRNGAGPTALVTGGNHGDEYEGPVSLLKAAASLDPGKV